jgi:hypothetical protein
VRYLGFTFEARGIAQGFEAGGHVWGRVGTIALVPAVAIFAATIAAVISSRVRTYQAAQSIAGLLLVPIFVPFYILAFLLQSWGPLAVLGGVVAVLALDLILVLVGAASWRREEVLARQ